ncbi:putative oxidoreductase [Thalassovita gelatinovora]|uniref:Putative oxidoreductase n=1 Tax=Thalassovita gelatinovora TaxID=53501 RepID=A0A0P1F5K4_THAGE|nr:nitroreductase [Thalassovita gelatinovora]QIZ80131.1 nitroreductase [Thalassovita gelatinovora]CUH63125.1 putative oxidoreductase [Thalassovita gelatinovora]SER21005.1 Nitroreductase [Thalassovita gelatinovora]
MSDPQTNPSDGDFGTLSSLLHDRHSCRGFLPDPVPDAHISRIVEAAQRVPSWCNAQPWQVIITSGTETDRFRDMLYAAAVTETPEPDLDWPKRYTGVYQSRRRTCGLQLYDAVGVERGDRAASGQQMLENYRLFGAPHVAIITSDRDLGPYGAMDCGGFIAAFTLAAQALGIASIPQAAVAAFASSLRDHFDIPNNRLILCAISFGYEDIDHPANRFRTERAPLSEVIDWRK